MFLRKILCRFFWERILKRIACNEKSGCEFLGMDLVDIHNHRVKFKYDLNRYFSLYKNEETHEYYVVYDNCIVARRTGICLSTLKNFKKHYNILKPVCELIIDENKKFTSEEGQKIWKELFRNSNGAFKCIKNKYLIV